MTSRSAGLVALFAAAGIFARAAVLAGPGSGTAGITPSATVVAGSTGTWSIQYTAAEAMKNGRLRITIPAGWSAPQFGNGSSAGYVTVSTNQPSGSPSITGVLGQDVTIDVDTLSVGNTVTLVYGDISINASGRATAATAVNTYTFLVASDPTGTSPVPIVTSPALSVIAAAPSYLEIAPSDTTVTAGVFAQYRLIVRDEYGNRAPVPSTRTVNLLPSSGAFYSPADHGTSITSIQIASGKTSVRIDYRGTLATAPGSPHSIFVVTFSGSPTLAGSDDVNIVPAALSTTQSTITATTPVIADGIDQSSVTVTSKDAFNNLRPGDDVALNATGSATVGEPGGFTNANGEATGVVTNTLAQNVTVSATINGQAITATAPITFTAGPVSGATSLVDATTPVVANGIASSTVTVTAKDANGNPVSGQTVTLAITPSGAGAVLTQPGGVTNALGVATGTLASTAVGLRTVTATIGATPVTDDAVVSFIAGAAASFEWAVDGTAVAGASEQVMLTVKDAQGHVVTGYTGVVSLTTNSTGVGDAVVQWSAPDALGDMQNLSGDNAEYTFAAGDNGAAVFRITDTKAESIILSATAAGPASGNSASITVSPGAPDAVQLVAGDGQSATVNTAVATPPKVKVVDVYGNAVAGATVTFTVLAGGGSRDVIAGGGVDATGLTASDGTIDCDVWRMGTSTAANPNQLRALIASGTTPNVDFTATATAGQGANLVLTPGSKYVTVASTEVVTATLTDSFGNLRSGEQVTVAVKSGTGTLAEDPGDPGTTTQVTARVRQGTTDAAGKITVLYQAPAGAGLVDVLDASTSNVPQSSVSDVTYTTVASGATNLRITWVGPSTQAANVAAQFTIEAVDGSGNRDTGNAATVTFTPEATSGLQFSLSNFGATLTQTTLSSGARTIYVRGTKAGNWDVTASTGGGIGPDTEVLTVTDTGVIDHYVASTVSSVTAGASFDVSVEAQDLYNNRVDGANNSITLTAVDDVTLNPLTPDLLVTSASLSGGVVTVGEQYTKADVIKVRVSNAGKQGISNAITVNAAAAKRITKVSGDGTGIAAGSNRTLTARVLDPYDNPVSGVTVTFTVTQGGGSVQPPSIASDASGNAVTQLTTGEVAGENHVRASIGDGLPAIDEQVEFSVVTQAGTIDHFTVVPQKTALVAGETVPLTITAYDVGNNVVTTDNTTQVQLSSTGSAQFGSVTGTLTAGVFTTTLRNDVVQNFTVTAQKQGGGPSNTSVTISVTNAGAFAVFNTGGNGSNIVAGTTRTLLATVRDPYNNVVPGALVTFSVLSAPDGTPSFTDTDGDPNDGIAVANASGVATVTYHTAVTAGTNTVNAQILDGSPAAQEKVSYTVNTIAGGITHYSVGMNATMTTAGVSKIVTVTALDTNENVVDNDVTQVSLSGSPGIGLVFGVNPITLTNGVASTSVSANQVQTYNVRAETSGNPSVNGIGPAVTVVPAAPAGTITATATQTTITANGASTTTITSGVIRDAFDNQVAAGEVVNVTAGIGGIIMGGPAKTVGADGQISFVLQSSTTVGTCTVTMTSATGTATGTINITFAPTPDLACNNPPVPAIVVPGSTVAFSVQATNSSSTSVTLTTATTFHFTDGTRNYTANLAAQQSIPGSGSTTLVFNSALVSASFTTASYQPTVTMVGNDAYGSAVNTPVTLPAASLLVTSIEITSIVPQFSVVSRGQIFDVAVTVKNNGATQNAVIGDVGLVFIPNDLFLVGNAPEEGSSINPGASRVFHVPVTVQASATVQSYQIDAVATGTVGGQNVSDTGVAPHPLASLQVTTAASLAYVPGTLTPTTVSRGDPYSFQVTIRNDGGGTVLLDSALTRLTFTDGTRTYSAGPVQPYAIAGGGSAQVMAFRVRTVQTAFSPGTYPATLNVGGTENGSPFTRPVALTGVVVQTPASVAYVPGGLSPVQVSKTTTATFSVQVQNTGGATVVLTPATTTIRFSGTQYIAALNPSGPTTLPPGTTTLQFLGATVSNAITNGTYAPTVQLTGTENGSAFSQSLGLTNSVTVQNPPSIAILNMLPSQPQFTTDQAKRIQVRMIVSNSNGAAANFSAASLRFIHAGQDRTSQFVISTPTTFQGGAQLTSGEIDTVLFNVSDNAGAMTPGNMTIEGELTVIDVNTSQPVFADTDVGGKGNLQVMTPAAITFDALIPSQTVVTAGMGRDFKVRAVVRNTGGSDAKLTLSKPSTQLNFSPLPGWQTSTATLAGGGDVLSGGETDTLIFTVTNSGTTPGQTSIGVVTSGVENNSGAPVSGSGPGLANILVQTLGAIQITNIVPSQPSITTGTTVNWTITVTLTNPGESDVNLALGGAVSLSIQNQSTPPAFTIPATLVGGGTLLSGGETDQLVIPLTTSGTYTSAGIKNITVDIDGTEVNSGNVLNGNGTGAVTVQQLPDASFVSLTPGTVSRSTNVAFAVTITNPNQSQGATLTLDRSLTRLRFGSNQYNVGLSQASPVSVPTGAQVTLQFTGAVVGAGIPTGPQGDAVLDLVWTHNGVPDNKSIAIPSAITVQAAPSLSIVSVRPSRATLTRSQAPAGTVTMVVQNSGGAAVDLDLSPVATRLGFKVLANGFTISNEYTVQAPAALASAGGTLLAGGATDSLIFNITQAGTTTGSIIVNGYVGGIDQNSSLPVSDDTFDGGSGSLELQLAGALSILSIIPSQPTATTGQTTKSYTVKMAVKNTGGAAIDVSLPQAISDIQFVGKSGFVHSDALMPNGVTLSGGETDTLRFTVTTTGGPAGLTTIAGNVAGVETNTGGPRGDDTGSGGTGSILLQTPASLVVDSVTPSQPSVTQSTIAPWSTTVMLHNAGESDARLNLPSGFTISVQSGATSFAPPVDMEEGGVILEGGASGTLVTTTPTTGAFSTLGNRAINVSVGATEVNSDRPFSVPGTGTVLVQSTPGLVVTAVRPPIVTSESVVDFEVDVQNPGANAATARFDRGDTRVHFANQAFSAFLDVASPDSVVGGATVTLRFEGKIIPASIAVGPYDFNVNLDYTHNGIARTEPKTVASGVAVQAAPALFIQQIVTSQPTVTAGQGADWTATMTVQNNGAADILLNLSSAKTRLTFIGPGGQPDGGYLVSAGVTASGNDTLSVSETDQIVFTITQTGTQTGNIVISGRVEGTDLNQLSPVIDDTFDGGRGGIVVQSLPGVSVLATHTSQPQVTVGQTGWSVRVVMRNTGGADVTLDLGTATTTIAGGGWVIPGPPTLVGGGNVLEGGAVDSLLFNVTTTPDVPGNRRIDASVPWTDINSLASGTAVTTTSGFGSITVESVATLRITTTSVTAPNPASVNLNQPFNITVQIQNTGGADARNVAVGMITDSGSAIQPVAPLAVVPGGQTVSYALPVIAAATSDLSEMFTTMLASAIDENSGLPSLVTLTNPPLDSTATLAIETPAVLDITGVRPSQPSVTRNQASPWSVIVRVHNPGQSDAVLAPPAANDIDFSLSGSTKIDYVVQPPSKFGSGAAGWTLAGGTTDSLIYSVVDTGNDPGLVDIGVSVDGTDRNDPTLAIADAGAGTVMVQDLAGLFILSTVPVGTVNHASAARDTVNTNFAYEIHVTVQNSGGEGVDSVLVDLATDGASTPAPASLKRQSIAAGASRDFVFRITAAGTPNALEMFTANILPGVKSANSGQTVIPQQPVDRAHQVVTQRPADLSMNLFVVSPPLSVGGVVATNQLFTLGARVSNLGQANVSGPAQLTLTVPSGFIVTDASLRTFAVGDTVTWTVTAPPATQSAQNFTCAITTTPNDVNTGIAASTSKSSDDQSVTVSSGGALVSPSITLSAPAGAVDDTLSVSQDFTVRASVTVSRIRNLVSTLTLPPGFTVVGGNLVRNLGNTAGNRHVDYSLRAPGVATSPDDLFVTFTAVDTISGEPVPSAADTARVTVVPRTNLSVSAGVTAPPDAMDNTVALGTPFTVTATVANAAGAADIEAPGSLQITLPALYTLAPGHTAQKTFVVGTAVSWVVNAASQPSGPDQIGVSIVNVPNDENSGLAAQVSVGAVNIAMVTEGAAVSVRNVSAAQSVGTGVAPGGADNLDVLAFEIAYNVTDTSVLPAEVDTIALMIIDRAGNPLGPGVVSQTLARIALDLGGSQPYVAPDLNSNPVRIPVTGTGTDRLINPDGSIRAVVYLDLDPSPRATELRVRVTNGMIVHDPSSGQPLGVTDPQGQPLDGQITSGPLVVLSSNFEEYAHNAPNPFRAGSAETQISYFLDAPSNVDIRIFDITGELVYEEKIPSSDPRAQPGPQESPWDGRNMKGDVVRNGIYVCVLNAGSKSAKIRIAVAK